MPAEIAAGVRPKRFASKWRKLGERVRLHRHRAMSGRDPTKSAKSASTKVTNETLVVFQACTPNGEICAESRGATPDRPRSIHRGVPAFARNRNPSSLEYELGHSTFGGDVIDQYVAASRGTLSGATCRGGSARVLHQTAQALVRSGFDSKVDRLY